jgi:hypothetical protein
VIRGFTLAKGLVLRSPQGTLQDSYFFLLPLELSTTFYDVPPLPICFSSIPDASLRLHNILYASARFSEGLYASYTFYNLQEGLLRSSINTRTLTLVPLILYFEYLEPLVFDSTAFGCTRPSVLLSNLLEPERLTVQLSRVRTCRRNKSTGSQTRPLL